jgi:hypothetical protein
VEVYPNPATTTLSITSTDEVSSIIISSLLGQRVYSNQYNSKEAQVDVADLPSGVYFVRINGTDVRKFVKQ